MTRVSLYPATPAAVYLRPYMGIITQPCVHITMSHYRWFGACAHITMDMCTDHHYESCYELSWACAHAFYGVI